MSITVETPVELEDLLAPSEEELRAAAIDELDEFDDDAPMVISNIDIVA